MARWLRKNATRLLVSVLVVYIYGVVYVVCMNYFSRGQPAYRYTASWASERMWIWCMLICAAMAVSGRGTAALISTGGYIAGIVLGEAIGAPMLRAAQARYEQALAGGLGGVARPSHQGWLIWLVVFAVVMVAGVAVDYYRRQRAAAEQKEL